MHIKAICPLRVRKRWRVPLTQSPSTAVQGRATVQSPHGPLSSREGHQWSKCTPGLGSRMTMRGQRPALWVQQHPQPRAQSSEVPFGVMPGLPQAKDFQRVSELWNKPRISEWALGIIKSQTATERSKSLPQDGSRAQSLFSNPLGVEHLASPGFPKQVGEKPDERAPGLPPLGSTESDSTWCDSHGKPMTCCP